MAELDPSSTSVTSVTPIGLTNEDRITRLYGSLGLGAILDDVSGDGETAVVNQFISDAEQTIMLRVGRFYEGADMATSDYFCSRATWIAAYFLSKRRGNEHYFESLYQQALNELDALATGEIPPIDDVPLKFNTLPSMSNLVVDDRYYSSKLRVKHFITVGSANPNRHTSFYGDFYGWI